MSTLIEVFAPKGSLGDEQRAALEQQLIPELVSAPGAPADLIERGRSITWLMVHEPDAWTIGGYQMEPGDQPRYLVRVTVPGGHLNEGMRREMVTRITRVLARLDGDGDRLYQRPDAWVHILELPDGHIGGFGQLLTTRDITGYVVKNRLPAHQDGDEPGDGDQGNGDGTAVPTVVDPICGMTVELTDAAIVLEHEGVTHGFCSTTCRDIFAERI